MPNNRVTYAISQLAFKENGATPGRDVLPLSESGVNPSGYWEVPRGVQSVASNVNFNIEPVFELGKEAVYENIEGIPDVELSVTRVFDGTHPLYLIASDEAFTTLRGRNEQYKTDIALNIYPDTNSNAEGDEVNAVYCSGMFLSSLTLNFPTDGNFTEELTFVGNNRFWSNIKAGGSMPSGNFPSGVIEADEDPTVNVGNLDGVQRRENFDVDASTFPTEIPSGECITNITVSADLGREDIFCLGSKSPELRFLTLPIEVTTTIEVITSDGDDVEADGSTDNLSNQTIILVTTEGLTVNLGTQNKLSTMDFGNLEAGTGQATVTYTYVNQNDLTITHADYL